MTSFDQLLERDALGQKELLDNKEITTIELTDFYIDRIQKYNPKLNAIVTEMFNTAREQAKKQTIGNGPVAGLPFLIKDLAGIKGVRLTHGSTILKDFVSPMSDDIVQRYEQAGLIFLGKTNTPEFGFLPTTEPDLFGPSINPWNEKYSTGGSSGGATSAVAAGLIPFAHASDGGGSIRIPASASGLFGLKPSRGRRPYGPYVNHLSIDHAVTRSVRDSAVLLDIIHGTGKHQLYPGYEKKASFLESLNERPRKLKIAVQYERESIRFDEETRKNMEKSILLMKDLGHEVVEIMPEFDFSNLAHHFINIWLATGAVVINHLAQLSGQEPNSENVESLSYQILQFGKKLSAYDYEESRVMLERTSQQILSFFDDFDIWMTPTLNQVPFKIGQNNEEVTNPYESMLNNMVDYNPYMPIANATGQPAMSVPTSWTNEGVPIGTHFFGRPGEESTLLQLAQQIENEQPWFHRYKDIEL
ncbi:amidase [Gracilibacillus halotolerans]|uniref:Amidase n=1 Tax=Gracilibacillus halotolerans TaxID=74386 RepID=A0A841RIF6_9BACI|nr:amidase [Gracilibacillus halotolerans]MBB6512451.1 amidase [Gracilibacillus halotolerans]